MIEILAYVKDSGSAKAGDVISAKLPDSPWDSTGVGLFHVFSVDDADLESRLTASTDPTPVISSPYASYATTTVGTRKVRTLTSASTKYVDIASLSADDQALIVQSIGPPATSANLLSR